MAPCRRVAAGAGPAGAGAAGRVKGALLTLAASHAGGCRSEFAPKRVFLLDGACIPHDLETGQELDITRRTAAILQGDTIGFVGGQVMGQFCFNEFSAVVSSARQESLLRPRITEPAPAASQIGPTLPAGSLRASPVRPPRTPPPLLRRWTAAGRL
jgi:hypothetical protein